MTSPRPEKDRHLVERYRRKAARYDADWARYTVGTLRRSLEHFTWRGDERVLDIGCGTGEVERLLLPLLPDLHFAALDLSTDMLEIARAKFSTRFALRWLRGHAQHLPFADAAFDVVLNLNAFHYFDEPVETLREFRRVLAPGGTCILTDWCTDRWRFRAIDLGMRVFDPAHHRIHRSKALRSAFEAAGFEGVRLETYGVGWFWGMATVSGRAPLSSELAPRARAALDGSTSSPRRRSMPRGGAVQST
ncbi:MAG: class I SAM-dependent methyltransferase [Planctomycetes bacterium]|nr:class I SAM-dependent methyltransferase [Planctomycetota bacterium]